MNRDLLADLAGHLRERVRVLRDGPRDGGAFVLCWLHHAVRGHENPALDTALAAAERLDTPVLVYQGLGGRHRFNADRHHAFILEGARDAAAELEARGVRHVLHLPEDPAAPSPLPELARRAGLVVTEEFPAPPFRAWTQRLADRVERPLWCVDAACVVPMQSLPPSDRAFRFRATIADELPKRLAAPWPDAPVCHASWDGPLPFTPLDLAAADIPALCAACAIDHGLPPVPHTPGGARAGYARWDAFRRDGLRGYARRRNDPLADGVSRLSPYLHHGHVSPLRIAREAHAEGGAGAEKFLDELIVWRELAHNLCFHAHEIVETLEILPGWARETLAAHADDPRDVRSWETLARACTGDRLWDAAQRSLLVHGELHNNVRMTWAKAVPAWSRDPAEALARLVDLNHRFALDGGDPNSYGGLLWALGLFDRPFPPERPVLGTVRGRDTAAHAARLDLEAYEARTARPPRRAETIAVIGGGLAGAAAARALADQGLAVTVLDKGRGPGGRAATRRRDDGAFDHGAQYFTARDPRFRRHVASWVDDGVAARWDGRLVRIDADGATPAGRSDDRFVGVPGMSAIVRHLLADVTVRFGRRVAALERDGAGWRPLLDDGGPAGTFDRAIVAIPAPQAAALLAGPAPELAARIGRTVMTPCWTLMAVFDPPPGADYDGAFVADGGPLGWVARDASKPRRDGTGTWVAQATAAWSDLHLEDEADAVAAALAAALAALPGFNGALPASAATHRWRYAAVAEPAGVACLEDGATPGLVACGDWCLAPRMEAAFLSGVAAAGRVLAGAAAPAPAGAAG